MDIKLVITSGGNKTHTERERIYNIYAIKE